MIASKIARPLIKWSIGMILIAQPGCGTPPEGDLPPPRVASPEEMETAIEQTSANAPRNDVPAPGEKVRPNPKAKRKS